MQFEFKEPIYRINPYAKEVLEKHFGPYFGNFYTFTRDEGSVRDYCPNVPISKNSSAFFYELLEKVSKELQELTGGEEGFLWERLCPYTGQVLEQYPVRNHIEPAKKYQKALPGEWYDSTFCSFEYKITKVSRQPHFKDLYSKSVIQLMRYEWGYSNPYDDTTENNAVMEDKVTSVGVYYQSKKSIEKKVVLLNKKRGRHIKTPNGIVNIPSPYIDFFDEKLKEIQNGDYSRYEEDIQAKKEIKKIKNILANTNLSSQEQLKEISQLF